MGYKNSTYLTCGFFAVLYISSVREKTLLFCVMLFFCIPPLPIGDFRYIYNIFRL